MTNSAVKYSSLSHTLLDIDEMSPTDIKPNIKNLNPTIPHRLYTFENKPTPSGIGQASFSSPIDFSGARAALRGRYELECSNLDLREELESVKGENFRLKQASRARLPVHEEAGSEVDLKPDISRGGVGGVVKPEPRENMGDDDDVVFLQMVKGGLPHDLATSPDQTGPTQHHSARSSGHEVEDVLTLDPLLPHDDPESTRNNLSLPTPRVAARNRQPPRTSIKPSKKTTTPNAAYERKRKVRSVSVGSSGPEPDSDVSDETYEGYPDDGPPGVKWLREKRKIKPPPRFQPPEQTSKAAFLKGRLQECQSDDHKSKKSRSACDDSEETSTGVGTSETGSESDSDSDDGSSSTDEATGPYRGPRLHVLSVRAINDRLDRTFRRYGLCRSTIDELALWWPKTIVAKYHGFDLKHHYLLTLGVHEWWSRLCRQVNSPTYDWPGGQDGAKRAWLLSRIKEIACQKEGAAVRGEREMKDGDDLAKADEEIDLDE